MVPGRRCHSLTGAVLFLGLLAVPGAALAQADAGGHLGHHPGGGAPAASTPAAPGGSAAPPGGGGGMGDMMGMPPPPASSGPTDATGGSGPSASPSANPNSAPTPPAGTGMGAAMGSFAPMPSSGSGSSPAASAPSVPPGGAMGGMMGAPPGAASGPQAGGVCGGMMGCMGGGAKPFYPALMDMPSLTPEARRFIEVEAAKRLGGGSEAITIGQVPLHAALSANDPAAMQQAAASLREGLLQVESGASALQAVNEGQQPRQIALTWFKTQMSVPVGDAMMMGNGPWGLSWFHLTMMAFLVAFLLGAILIHYARLRRIDGLVDRLTPGGAAAAPPAGKPGPASARTAPAAAATPGPAPAAGAGTVPPAAPPKADTPKRPWSGALRVAAIFRETPNVKTFRLMEPGGGEIPFTFLPGQFLTFSATIDDKPIRRSYTIASSPAQRDFVEITVKREEQGAESRYLHDHIAIGDHLEVAGPSGVFTFTGKETDSIVLVSGGVGITPMMCVLRYLTDCGYRGDIFFLHGTRTAQDFIFREELEYLQKRHANAHVAATMSDEEEGTSWPGARGNISKEFIARTVPDIARRRIHVCGPPAMMQAVKAELLELGVVKDKIKTEAFGPALGAVPAPAAAPPSADPASAPAAPAPAAAPAAPTAPAVAAPSAQVEVQFKKAGKSGPLAPNKCVLEAAEAIGVAIDFSCRVGTCGTCVVPLLEGSVTMEVEEGPSRGLGDHAALAKAKSALPIRSNRCPNPAPSVPL